jgi:2-polyprenyl-3-methyl-5-hydroxy-6-metoxy-1,4-benzoquinol methylase
LGVADRREVRSGSCGQSLAPARLRASDFAARGQTTNDKDAMNPTDADQTTTELKIELPEPAADLAQDEEWYELTVDGEARRIGFHDYAQTFAVPGAYERLFYDMLKCDSPRTVCGLLDEQLSSEGRAPQELRVLDVGAGNGMVGEKLQELEVDQIVGVDIIEEAAGATERDRPGVYDDYHVVDLTAMPERTREELAARRFNCMTSVAALGFGDIPPDAFTEAYNLIEPEGLVGFSLKESMVSGEDSSGFSRLIEAAIEEGDLTVAREHRYRHRLDMNGDPLYYVAMIGEKVGDLQGG